MNVIVPGTFDCFHEGHKKLIDYAWLMSGKTTITLAINSGHISELNGKYSRDNIFIREENIYKYLMSKDINAKIHFILNPEDTIKIAKKLAPCFWLTGRDWDLEKTSIRNEVKETFWEENEIYIVYKDRVPNISSTKERSKK